MRFWSGRWSFFDFICSQFLFFMTRATTLPQRVNRNSERFARYEPQKMITFLRKWYRGPKSLTAHKKSAWLWEKLGDTGLFFSLLSRSGVRIWLFFSCSTVLSSYYKVLSWQEALILIDLHHFQLKLRNFQMILRKFQMKLRKFDL